ncbi:MAG: hypothetical protein Q8Q36_01170 [bacterium]|nr:hypothetical protein [bacterium]
MKLEAFEQSHEEIPQTYLGYKTLIGGLQEKIDSADFDNLSRGEKLESLSRTEERLQTIDEELETLFVNPKANNEYSDLKELVAEAREKIQKWHRQLERPN